MKPTYAILSGIVLLSLLSTVSHAADSNTAVVNGTINVDGRPVQSGRIFLFVDNEQFVGAKIRKDGTFRLKHVPPGVYKVSIEGDRVHDRYHAEDKSGLSVKLDGGPNTCDFDLRW